MSSSAHVDNKKKDILILGEGPTEAWDDTTLAVEKKYWIIFTEHNKKFCLCLHYNGANSYFFVSVTEIYEFKAKDPKINEISLCLGNISKDVSADNIWKLLDFMLFQLMIHYTYTSI